MLFRDRRIQAYIRGWGNGSQHLLSYNHAVLQGDFETGAMDRQAFDQNKSGRPWLLFQRQCAGFEQTLEETNNGHPAER